MKKYMTISEWSDFIKEYTKIAFSEISNSSKTNEIQNYINHIKILKRMKKKMKVIMLGYTEVGKSYYLASLNNLRIGTSPNNFSIQYENYIEINRLGDMQEIIEKSSSTSVVSTMKIVKTPMIFKQSNEKLFMLEFNDIEGQAMEPGRSKESAIAIRDHIKECDAIVMVLKAPTNEAEQNEAISQFAQIRLFAEELISKKEIVPMCLILNQIDILLNAKGISSIIEKKIADSCLDNQLSHDGWAEIEKEMQNEDKIKGEAYSEALKKVLYTREMVTVVTKFNDWILAQNKRIPSRVFFSSSIGFDNLSQNGDSKNNFKVKNGMKPFGSVASILWLIYTYIRSNEDELSELGVSSEIRSKLLQDIECLHNTGQSFYDNNGKYWNLRNLNQLYPIHDANRKL